MIGDSTCQGSAQSQKFGHGSVCNVLDNAAFSPLFGRIRLRVPWRAASLRPGLKRAIVPANRGAALRPRHGDSSLVTASFRPGAPPSSRSPPSSPYPPPCARRRQPQPATPFTAGTRARLTAGQLSGGASRRHRARRVVVVCLLPRGAARGPEESGAARARVPLGAGRWRDRRGGEARRTHRAGRQDAARRPPGARRACAQAQAIFRRRASISRSRCAGRSPI